MARRIIAGMARFLAPLLLLISSESFADGIKVAVEPGKNPWTHLRVNNDPKTFQFAIVTDRTGGHREGVFESAMPRLNLLQPEFVMSVGDLIEGYTEDLPEIHRQWDEFDGFVRQLSMPFFYVPGNHDVTNPVMAKVWNERLGRDHYWFTYRDVLFIALNTEGRKGGGFDDPQVEMVKAALAANRSARWTLLFFHKPVWTSKTTTGLERIETLLQGRKYSIFAGHNHDYTAYERHDMRYITLATTGAISDMRGIPHGEFDHVVWVTMTDQGPIVANLLLSGILPWDVATETSREAVGAMGMAAPRQATGLGAPAARAGRVPFRLRSTNDSDRPVTVKVEFDPPAGYVVVPPVREVAVPPNEVGFLDFEYARVAAPLAGGEVPPALPFAWTTSIPDKAGTAVALTGESAVRAEPPLPVTVRAKPPRIDGALDDWGALPIPCDRTVEPEIVNGLWTGPADLSARIAVAQDAKFLYVAVDTTDDQREWSKWTDPWSQDGLMVTVDARPEGDRDAVVKERKAVTLFLSPGDTATTMTLYDKDHWPKGVDAACRATKTGHVTEVAIPHAILNTFGQKDWKTVRINVCLYDFDGTSIATGLSGYGSYFWWRPDWDGARNFPGSGTFRRR